LDRRGAIQRRAKEEVMTKDLLQKLRKTKSVTLSNAVVRSLDESDLASVVGGQRICQTNSASDGTSDDCAD
jgi:hypothetical protein